MWKEHHHYETYQISNNSHIFKKHFWPIFLYYICFKMRGNQRADRKDIPEPKEDNEPAVEPPPS